MSKTRSRYGNARVGRAVSTAGAAISSASSALWFIIEQGGVLDLSQIDKWKQDVERMVRHLNMLRDLTFRQPTKQPIGQEG